MSIADLVDPTAAKIVLAADRGDSIRRISEKIGVSYSWVYDWVQRLDDADIVVDTDNGLRVSDHELRDRYDALLGTLYSREAVSREDAYVLPHFAGMEFAHTAIDAAYVWTRGGFQIARSHEDYPVFVRVHDRDVERWEAFFQRYGVDVAVGERLDASDVDGAVHYVLIPVRDVIEAEWVDGSPVVPLDEAVEQMTTDRAAYEPALEIVAEEYDVEIDASHHDSRVSDD